MSPNLPVYQKARIEVLLRRGEYQDSLSVAQSFVEGKRSDENLGVWAIALAMSGKYPQSKEIAVEIGDFSTLKTVNFFISSLELLALGDKISGAKPDLSGVEFQCSAGALSENSPIESRRN